MRRPRSTSSTVTRFPPAALEACTAKPISLARRAAATSQAVCAPASPPPSRERTAATRSATAFGPASQPAGGAGGAGNPAASGATRRTGPAAAAACQRYASRPSFSSSNRPRSPSTSKASPGFPSGVTYRVAPLASPIWARPLGSSRRFDSGGSPETSSTAPLTQATSGSPARERATSYQWHPWLIRFCRPKAITVLTAPTAPPATISRAQR